MGTYKIKADKRTIIETKIRMRGAYQRLGAHRGFTKRILLLKGYCSENPDGNVRATGKIKADKRTIIETKIMLRGLIKCFLIYYFYRHFKHCFSVVTTG